MQPPSDCGSAPTCQRLHFSNVSTTRALHESCNDSVSTSATPMDREYLLDAFLPPTPNSSASSAMFDSCDVHSTLHAPVSDCVCGPARLRARPLHFPVLLRLYVPSCLQVVGYSPEFPEATLSHAHRLLLVECSLLASVNPHTRALPWLAAPHSILLVPLSRSCVLPCRHLETPLHTRDHAALATSSNCLATFTDLARIQDVPYPEYRSSPATLPPPCQ